MPIYVLGFLEFLVLDFTPKISILKMSHRAVFRSKLNITWLKMEGACNGPEAPLRSARISEARLCASLLGWPLKGKVSESMVRPTKLTIYILHWVDGSGSFCFWLQNIFLF